MSMEPSTQHENGNGGDAGGGDLSSQLAGGDTEFIATEEKKPATQGLIFLAVLVLVGVGGTYFMYTRQGPATAAAAATPEAQKAEKTINTFLTSGPDGIKSMHSMLKDTEKVVKQFLEYPSVTQVPLSSLNTNPFQSGAGAANAADPDADAKELERKRELEKQAITKASEAL